VFRLPILERHGVHRLRTGRCGPRVLSGQDAGGTRTGVSRTRRAVPGPLRRRRGGGAAEAFVQVVGALLVLAGFGAAQYGVLDLRSVPYLLLNLAGSAVLAVDALLGREWGFLLLEGVWAVVSAGSLLSLARGRARDRVST